jgi:hypothetical protein
MLKAEMRGREKLKTEMLKAEMREREKLKS